MEQGPLPHTIRPKGMDKYHTSLWKFILVDTIYYLLGSMKRNPKMVFHYVSHRILLPVPGVAGISQIKHPPEISCQVRFSDKIKISKPVVLP